MTTTRNLSQLWSTAPWLAPAWAEFGQAERPGADHNARIVALFADSGHPNVTEDEVAWCAAFTGACLQRTGISPSGSLMARSYLKWGTDLSDGVLVDRGPDGGLIDSRLGAVAVFSRSGDPAAGHVGFLIGESADHMMILGGNQSNAVTVAAYPRARLLGLRWPNSLPATVSGAATNARQQPRPVDPIFDSALAHVLQMEGGYTDDPLDPGGPTNRGITLATFAKRRGVAITTDNRDRLIADLRAISDDETRSIYHNLYWRPAACPNLPPALSLFHFDTAVNMGVGTAARMLQTALGVDADGEIGPITLGAATRADPARLLTAYAELRRVRYRSLTTFRRFGRGWLARVDKTFARALTLSNVQPRKGPAPMSTLPTNAPHDVATTVPQADPAAPKWWGHSLTIWGALVTGLAAILPAVGPVIGVEIPRETVTTGAEQIGTIAQAAAGLAGTVMTIFGRLRADRPLARRRVTVSI